MLRTRMLDAPRIEKPVRIYVVGVLRTDEDAGKAAATLLF